MEPFYEQTEDPEYLVFDDYSEELKKEYEKDVRTCIRFPDGRVVNRYSSQIYGRFVVEGNVVKAASAGRMHRPKRNRKAKKLKLLPDYPIRKLFDTWQAYAESEGYYRDPESGGYGYLYNPDGHWDWYVIGGRWPARLLVSDTCTECTPGERNGKPPLAPAGYKWVSAARKKDIAWDVMRSWKKTCAVEQYKKLKASFEQGEMLPDVYGLIDEKGILVFGGYVYLSSETLEEYLARCGIDENDTRYPDSFYNYIDKGEWFSNAEYDLGDKKDDPEGKEKWHDAMHKFIDDLSDDAVLVVVDCHS